MPGQVQKEVTEFLQHNYDMMTYSPVEMNGVSLKVIVHRLNMKRDLKLVK